MTTITTRAGKGSPLTNTEVDDNFSNLNSAKYESGASPTFGSTILTTADTVNLTLDGASANSKNIYFKGDSSAQRGRIASIGTSLYFQLTVATNYLTINPGSTVINDSSVDHDFRVESNDNANMLFVDAGANHVNIGTPTDYGSTFNVGGNTALNRGTNGATTASGATLSIQGTGNFNSNYFGSSLATVAIRSNEPANNSWNPTLHITTIRQSLGTNQNSNGGIGFSTIDDSNNTGVDDAARITIFNENSSSNTSPTAIRFYNNVGGSKTQASQAALDLFSTGAVFNNDSNDMDFRIESDGQANMLFVDGSSNRVIIGSASPNASHPTAQFQVGGSFTFSQVDLNSNSVTDTGISINQGNAGMAMQVLASNHADAGTNTQAGQYFLKFYYSGNNAPTATLVAGDNCVTFGVSASNTLTVQMRAGANSISFITNG